MVGRSIFIENCLNLNFIFDLSLCYPFTALLSKGATIIIITALNLLKVLTLFLPCKKEPLQESKEYPGQKLLFKKYPER